jgi:hypothetical protein
VNGDRPDAGHDLALRKMAVADDPLLARLGLQIGMLCEKLSNLRFDRLGQQRTRAIAQDLGQGIGKGPWLGLITLLSDTAYHSFIGEVEALNTTTDTPPYPVMPSPTSGHSSSILNRMARWRSPGHSYGPFSPRLEHYQLCGAGMRRQCSASPSGEAPVLAPSADQPAAGSL